jgi:hypothetical protein
MRATCSIASEPLLAAAFDFAHARLALSHLPKLITSARSLS